MADKVVTTPFDKHDLRTWLIRGKITDEINYGLFHVSLSSNFKHLVRLS